MAPLHHQQPACCPQQGPASVDHKDWKTICQCLSFYNFLKGILHVTTEVGWTQQTRSGRELIYFRSSI